MVSLVQFRSNRRIVGCGIGVLIGHGDRLSRGNKTLGVVFRDADDQGVFLPVILHALGVAGFFLDGELVFADGVERKGFLKIEYIGALILHDDGAGDGLKNLRSFIDSFDRNRIRIILNHLNHGRNGNGEGLLEISGQAAGEVLEHPLVLAFIVTKPYGNGIGGVGDGYFDIACRHRAGNRGHVCRVAGDGRTFHGIAIVEVDCVGVIISSLGLVVCKHIVNRQTIFFCLLGGGV